MKAFKQLFRAVVVVALVGGWALASAAVHVIRAPGQSFPVVITKDKLVYKDTYVDTRNWTITDDQAHPAVVARLIQLGQTDVLAHTVNTSKVSAETQLRAAVATPNVTADAKSVVDTVKAKLN